MPRIGHNGEGASILGPYSRAAESEGMVYLSARTTIGVKELPLGAMIEIEMIAIRKR